MERLSRLRFMQVDRTATPVRRRIRSRGVPNALQDREIAYVTSAAEASEVTSQLIGRCEVVPQGDLEEFHCAVNGISLIDVTMAYVDFAVATDVVLHSSADCYLVHMTTSGEAEVTVDGSTTELSAFFALVVSPGSSLRLHLGHDSPQMVIRIERDAVERTLSRLLGRSLDAPIIFETTGDLTTHEASRWTSALNMLSAEVIDAGSLVRKGIGAGALEDFIVSTLLYVHRSNYSEDLRAEHGPSGRAAVRRSIEYIDQHLAEPITMADLASWSGMSVRSIQAGFREDLGTSPTAFILERRLQETRRALMTATREDRVSVTDVATRWGFSHLGSFSVRYRKRFGESPSQTLRR
ncbi:AraC family transcriptional regulator [Marihabitans asiaticum]|uniref:AraC family transcriptional regulator n=1 Tax=Marihabitans asiaticum TaxID=415218 RepID=UPI0011A69C3A|nr:AraC family transcriptional regulator [Marihabitans asiaticum]